jgi:hypothetical protein
LENIEARFQIHSAPDPPGLHAQLSQERLLLAPAAPAPVRRRP